MSSKTARPVMRSAAWRISVWATLAFACGTLLVFAYLHRFMADDIQSRTDAWLSGEIEVLGDVAQRTPKNALYGRVVDEVAELASKEVPNREPGRTSENNSVFFLEEGGNGGLRLWVGKGDGQAHLAAIQQSRMSPDVPSSIRVKGFDTPFRVASLSMGDGSHIYLGLSEKDQLRLLRGLRLHFILLWLLIVLLAFLIVFFTTRRVLGHVRKITEAASRIGQWELSSRVPTVRRNDEVAQLALTLNRMLDRIEASMHQLHTITDSLAHDLRSPLTAIRGKLEFSLSSEIKGKQTESIIAAVDELDRLTEFLNKSLDVAEAKADALRLRRTQIDLDELFRVMIDLYEPCMFEKGLRIRLRSSGPLYILADEALMHRMVSNLFDNELKHLSAACTVSIELQMRNQAAEILLEDDGSGFAPEVVRRIFERHAKGVDSSGRGLGLAFVEAVIHTHGGTVTASNRPQGGARLAIVLPCGSGPSDSASGQVRQSLVQTSAE
ncbi:MAG: HAMP domain-containing protein [Acidobacteria bacterium]|nr:HAMP domain-containing protein [Acidobacteriota bacterium]